MNFLENFRQLIGGAVYGEVRYNDFDALGVYGFAGGVEAFGVSIGKSCAMRAISKEEKGGYGCAPVLGCWLVFRGCAKERYYESISAGESGAAAFGFRARPISRPWLKRYIT